MNKIYQKARKNREKKNSREKLEKDTAGMPTTKKYEN
jgi:hypothetical protein